jgi:hypothetical protein
MIVPGSASPLLASAGVYNLTNSLRFRSSASAYLNRTPASASNRTTWTWSAWVKRGDVSSNDNRLFGAGTSNSDRLLVAIENYISVVATNSGSNVLVLQTTPVYRDPSAWYHIVVAIDTTQATASNRAKIYVNGVQVTAFGTATYPSPSTTLQVNSANPHVIGTRGTYSVDSNFDGYMTEVNFIDGQALIPSSFGQTSATTGVWIPKKYTGTYGTNGFYLPFTDNSGATATTIGKDFSGNGNNWTPNNISVTAGSTYDSMTDVPTLTSTTAANYCVLNPLDSYATAISNGNLKFSDGSGNAYQAYSTMSNPDIATYKFYCEVTAEVAYLVGIVPESKSAAAGSTNRTNVLGYYSNGNKYNGTSASAYGASFTSGDIIGIAVGNGQVEFYKNGTSQGVAFSGLTGAYKFATWAAGSAGIGCSFNFGQRPFSYTPPTGFLRLNTFNLPTPTITQPNKYFDAKLYTGNGGTQSITGFNFSPDFIWAKSRSNAVNHNIYDSIRGVNKLLSSSLTDAEYTGGTGLTSFNSDGYTTGSDSWLNASGQTYVAWGWDANGTGVTNTAGSITSTVSANTTAGFSIVTYTGTGGSGSVGHGLGAVPSVILIKARSSATNWRVYNANLGITKYLVLNSPAAEATASMWGTPDPTTFIIGGTGYEVNESGVTYVAYCFAQVAGYSKFGSYTGNGSADGTFVYTGFRPRYIMWKAAAYNWNVFDTSRSPYNFVELGLRPNTADVEYAGGGGTGVLDILSNGFKLRNAGAGFNDANTYIYMAFAESPFKYANAR